MSIPFKAEYEFQTSQGSTMLFNKKDPRIETLDIGNIIIVKDKLYKIINYDSASFFLNKLKKNDTVDEYQAFVVKSMR